jgi:hypothetical protein
LGYEPNELPGCSTPQSDINNRWGAGQTRDAMVSIMESDGTVSLSPSPPTISEENLLEQQLQTKLDLP